jgi:hypothetical protein
MKFKIYLNSSLNPERLYVALFCYQHTKGTLRQEVVRQKKQRMSLDIDKENNAPGYYDECKYILIKIGSNQFHKQITSGQKAQTGPIY